MTTAHPDHASFESRLRRALRRLTGGGPTSPVAARSAAPELIDASVTFDTFAEAVAGLRSAAGVADRQVVLSAGDVVAVLDFAVEADGVRVTGQVHGLDAPVAVQVLDAGELEVALCVSDDLGQFELVIEPGEYAFVWCDHRREVRAVLSVG